MPQSDPRGTHAAIQNITQWARRPEWAALHDDVLQEHIGDVLEKYGFDSADALAGELGQAAFGSSVFGPAFEDFLTREGDNGESIVDEYLRRRGYKESVPGRRYLEALGNSMMSLYEVIESVPGSHIVLRDLVRGGQPVRAEERSGSRQVVRWDIIATRILIHNRQQILSGVMLKFEPQRAQAILGALTKMAQDLQREVEERIIETATKPAADESAATAEEAAYGRALQSIIREQAGTDDPDAIRRFVDGKLAGMTKDMTLHQAAPVLTRLWLEQTLDRLAAPPPELRNYDGEPILPTETRWPIAADAAAEVEKRLDAAEHRRIYRSASDQPCWNWEGDKSLSRGPQDAAMSYDSWQSDGPLDLVSLGNIEIERDSLLLRTNSEARAARGRALLDSLLDGLLEAPAISHQDIVAEAMAHRAIGGPRLLDADIDEPLAPPDIPAEEKARILNEFKDRHYRSWLDRTIPMLGGKTPRQAVQGEESREQLVRLLKELENTELHNARRERMPPYDTSWMWRELGLRAEAA
jgi:hypothetical protein